VGYHSAERFILRHSVARRRCNVGAWMLFVCGSSGVLGSELMGSLMGTENNADGRDPGSGEVR
jgi:hypothetical protein